MTRRIRPAVAIAVATAFATGAAAQARPADTARWIVFAASTPDVKVAQLYRISSTGDGLRQLTKGAYPSITPAFSPNGKRVAFARPGVGLETMNVDGTGLRRLTTNPRDGFPVWSPDGKRIAFLRAGRDAWHVWTISTAKRAAPHKLKHSPPSGRPNWTKQAGLLVPSGGDLVRLDPKTGKVVKYYSANIDAVWGMDSTAVASDVAMIAFLGARDPDPGDMECGEGPCQRFALFVESLKTTKKRPLLLFKDVGPPGFSPNGKQLVFSAHDRLEIASRSGGPRVGLDTGDAVPALGSPPAWQP